MLDDGVELIYDSNLLAYEPEYISIDVFTNKSAVMILSEQYYPGWEVYIDGEKEEVFEVDYFLRGVLLSEGRHHVEFRYIPRSFYVGAFVTFSGILLVVVSIVFYFVKPSWYKY